MESRDNVIRKLRVFAIMCRAMEIREERKRILLVKRSSGMPLRALKNDIPFVINKLPEFNEPWIDQNEQIFNGHKHNISCAKGRKKRKKKKRSR